MIQVIDSMLSQWDVGRIIKVTNTNATHIHLANQGDSKAVIMELVNSQALIPNYLLQTGKTLLAYAVVNGVTIESKSFVVQKRERPEDYVYDDDRRNYIYELISDAEEAVENANIATQNANEAADKANQAAKSWVIVGEASGDNIAIDDAIDQSFAGFRIFGKTTQNGTPTPDAPVELESVGDSGILAVNVIGDNYGHVMIVATPNGLPGIPVSTGGNYTDANGQQWISDEIDFARGVYVQRVLSYAFKGTELVYAPYWESTGFSCDITKIGLPSPKAVSSGLPTMCNYLHNGGTTKNTITVEGLLYFRNIGSFADSYEVKAWLKERFEAGNPFVVVYALATTIETPLSEEDLAFYATLHTYSGNTTVSNEASAHMNVKYFMDAKKYIDSLVGTVSASAKLTSVSLPASKWKTEAENLHSQVVTVAGATPYSKVDLLPSVEQLAIFHNKDVSFVTENENGVITVYAIGDKPLLDYTMQAQITEVVV